MFTCPDRRWDKHNELLEYEALLPLQTINPACSAQRTAEPDHFVGGCSPNSFLLALMLLGKSRAQCATIVGIPLRHHTAGKDTSPNRDTDNHVCYALGCSCGSTCWWTYRTDAHVTPTHASHKYVNCLKWRCCEVCLFSAGDRCHRNDQSIRPPLCDNECIVRGCPGIRTRFLPLWAGSENPGPWCQAAAALGRVPHQKGGESEKVPIFVWGSI